MDNKGKPDQMFAPPQGTVPARGLCQGLRGFTVTDSVDEPIYYS